MARMGMNMGRRRGREEELGGWVHRDLELAAGRSAPQGGLCIFGSPLSYCGHSACTDTQTLPQRGNGVCIISLDRQHSQHSQICSPIMSTQRRRSEFPISLSAGSGTGTICAPLAPPTCRPRHCTKYSPVAVVVVLATHPEVCRTHMSNPNLHTSETCFVTAARDYCCSL